MRFKQDRTISIVSDKFLEVIDSFTYLGCNISSTESDVNIHLRGAFNRFPDFFV